MIPAPVISLLSEAHYNRFTKNDWDIMLYSLTKIAERAGDRHVVLFTIPSAEDFAWAREKGYDFKIVHDLQKLAKRKKTSTITTCSPAFWSMPRPTALITTTSLIPAMLTGMSWVIRLQRIEYGIFRKVLLWRLPHLPTITSEKERPLDWEYAQWTMERGQ